LIEQYGDPDYLWLITESTTEARKNGRVLYWDPLGMFAELSPIADNKYTVKKTTDVAMILFSDEQQVTAIDGKLLKGEKILWKGYGDYQP
jgi:hypothetical protein